MLPPSHLDIHKVRSGAERRFKLCSLPLLEFLVLMLNVQSSCVELDSVSAYSDNVSRFNMFAYLPLLVPGVPIRRLWNRSACHLGLIVFHILLRKRCAHLLVRLEVGFRTVFATIRCGMALIACLKGHIGLTALCAAFWCLSR